MRKILALALLTLLVVPTVPAGAEAEPGQRVAGSIQPPPIPAKNVSRGGRSMVILQRMTNTNGVGAWWFDVKPETIGGHFTLKPNLVADVDVFFYSELGDLGAGASVISGQYSNEDTNGEKGFVPEGSTVGAIFYGPCAGCEVANVGFVYEAETAPVITIDSRTDLGTTTVHVGGTIKVVNATGAPAWLRSTGTPTFDTGSFTDPATLSFEVFESGSYPFTTSTGATGTITVV